MSPLAKLLKMSFIDKRPIAEFDNVGLYEVNLQLEKASPEDMNLLRIEHMHLLPSRAGGEYLTVSEAHKTTGISEDRLRKLSNSGELKAVKAGGQWFILHKSLNEYLKDHPSSRISAQ